MPGLLSETGLLQEASGGTVGGISTELTTSMRISAATRRVIWIACFRRNVGKYGHCVKTVPQEGIQAAERDARTTIGFLELSNPQYLWKSSKNGIC